MNSASSASATSAAAAIRPSELTGPTCQGEVFLSLNDMTDQTRVVTFQSIRRESPARLTALENRTIGVRVERHRLDAAGAFGRDATKRLRCARMIPYDSDPNRPPIGRLASKFAAHDLFFGKCQVHATNWLGLCDSPQETETEWHAWQSTSTPPAASTWIDSSEV
jgi:hypothetical protein